VRVEKEQSGRVWGRVTTVSLDQDKEGISVVNRWKKEKGRAGKRQAHRRKNRVSSKWHTVANRERDWEGGFRLKQGGGRLKFWKNRTVRGFPREALPNCRRKKGAGGEKKIA